VRGMLLRTSFPAFVFASAARVPGSLPVDWQSPCALWGCAFRQRAAHPIRLIEGDHIDLSRPLCRVVAEGHRLLTEGNARIERQRTIIARLEQLGIDSDKQTQFLTRLIEAHDRATRSRGFGVGSSKSTSSSSVMSNAVVPLQ
jgi:hypothetical protein